jgi:hypothetical protein
MPIQTRLSLIRASLGAYLLAASFFANSAAAQWVSESYPLKAGWNSIWLSQDCSYSTVDALLADKPEIIEIWRWNSFGSAAQFTTSPPRRSQRTRLDCLAAQRSARFDTLLAHSEFRLSGAGRGWNIEHGQPPADGQASRAEIHLPEQRLNFLGFPTQTPDTSAGTFDRFSPSAQC